MRCVSREEARGIKRAGDGYFTDNGLSVRLNSPREADSREMASNVMDIRGMSCSPGPVVIEAACDGKRWASEIVRAWR